MSSTTSLDVEQTLFDLLKEEVWKELQNEHPEYRGFKDLDDYYVSQIVKAAQGITLS